METEVLEQIRSNLAEKRDNLRDWLRTTPPPKRQIGLGPSDEQSVLDHLRDLDEAVDKADSKTLGICTVCHGHVDTELLEMDYRADVCLQHLPAEELRKLEAELELAKTVQRSLLPQQVPETPFLEVAAFSRPAQIVGGDYFGFFRFSDGSEGLAIADVAGHGISASLHMASIHALLHTLIPGSRSPAEVLEHVHRLFVHNIHFSTFVTMFLSAYNPVTRSLAYCNAGHNPPLVFRGRSHESASPDWLWPTSAAVGLVDDATFGVKSYTLEPGDLLLMYTDGLTEAQDAQGEEFGRQRLAHIVRRSAGASAQAVVHEVRDGLERFIAGQSPQDDTTVVVCRILG